MTALLRPLALTFVFAAQCAAAACPVLDSRDWSADLVAARDGGYTLIVRGTVDLPSPGYALEWREGPMDRALPPGWRVDLVASPPEGVAAQIVTPTRIEARFDTKIDRFRVLDIRCGGAGLAGLRDIAASD